MQFVGMTLNDGRVQPEFALEPLLHVTARERPNSPRDLLSKRVLREFEEERPFGRFGDHAVGSGSRPHKVRRPSRSTRSCVLSYFEPGRQDSEILLVAWPPLPFEQFPLGLSDRRRDSS